MPRQLSPKMRATLEALSEWEGMLGSGTTMGEVEASQGSRSSLYLAVKKGWVTSYAANRHRDDSDSATRRYYRTEEGTAALEADNVLGETGLRITIPGWTNND